MTVNAVIALILHFFPPKSTDFQADYITVVEDRPIMSVKYCLRTWSAFVPAPYGLSISTNLGDLYHTLPVKPS